jgi:polar amino acid transport system permease protein
MQTIIEARGPLLAGSLVTVELFLASAALATVFSVLAGLARLAESGPVRIIAAIYVELFRGTSAVVQLFWLYFVLPFWGVRISAFQAATLGLALCFGAYGSEIIRSAVLAVPRGQLEAATALNMTRFQRMTNVIAPQAMMIMLPSYGNILILLLKGTSVASMITVGELTFQAYTLNVRTLATVQIFSVVLILYYLLSLVITRFVAFAERRFGRWRLPDPMTTVGVAPAPRRAGHGLWDIRHPRAGGVRLSQ